MKQIIIIIGFILLLTTGCVEHANDVIVQRKGIECRYRYIGAYNGKYFNRIHFDTIKQVGKTYVDSVIVYYIVVSGHGRKYVSKQEFDNYQEGTWIEK